jgi:hypothetical protein
MDYYIVHANELKVNKNRQVFYYLSFCYWHLFLAEMKFDEKKRYFDL